MRGWAHHTGCLCPRPRCPPASRDRDERGREHLMSCTKDTPDSLTGRRGAETRSCLRLETTAGWIRGRMARGLRTVPTTSPALPRARPDISPGAG